MRLAPLLLLNCAPALAHNSEDLDPYFITTWVVVGLLFSLYIFIIMISFPYAQPRVPLILFSAATIIPPVFLLLMIYVFTLFCLVPLPLTRVVVANEARERSLPAKTARERSLPAKKARERSLPASRAALRAGF